LLHVDHRVCDAAEASKAVRRFEELLNGELADEVRLTANRP
jgi:pyruvate/2-oxoglutarate dehydrogenase complex dihydrolipoamide acyltransferase (E2) component